MTDPCHNSGHRPTDGASAPIARQAHAAIAAPVNLRRAITAVAAIHIPESEAEARFAELKAQLPSRAARRMSRLGLMLSHLIGQVGIGEETVVIYGSMFGEGSTLESYLASFPHPSPLGFQSSIHPGGVEQALIFRQQPVREFLPVTASENLPLALFRTVSLCHHAERILLLGGEECGSWLHEHGLAADSNFAFALLLELPAQAPAPLGWLHPQEAPTATAQEQAAKTMATGIQHSAGTTLLELSTALATREAIDFCHPDEGHWSILWQGADSDSHCTLPSPQ